jgi:thiosulfate reductase cytochrome b subunit
MPTLALFPERGTQLAMDAFSLRKCYSAYLPDAPLLAIRKPPRHAAYVRVTHWITALAFVTLLVSGIEIVISHPRFYWGETGNVLTKPVFQIPIPSSRDTVPTGFHYVLPDQNGWSRYLHFQSAWAVLVAGVVYGTAGFLTGHFGKDLVPRQGDITWKAVCGALANHLRSVHDDDAGSYNVMQRITYLAVIFVLFPLIIWTGLALSPMFNAAVPAAVNVLGGRQSARTLHFFVSLFLLLFVVVHTAMVARAGFRNRTRAMITGSVPTAGEHS